MRIIGVLDLLNGRAVHARAGRRDTYAPVQQACGRIVAGSPAALARAYVEVAGVDTLYAADLDAIASGTLQEQAIRAVAVQAPLLLDAGVTSADGARCAVGLGAASVVVGLETLSSFAALHDICAAVGRERVVFSLDLRDGLPVGEEGVVAGMAPAALARRAIDAGAGAVTVIDLARVGTGRGVDLELIAGVCEAVPGVDVIAGGGVRGAEDLAGLAAAGCSAALVATALHDGRLTAGPPHAARER